MGGNIRGDLHSAALSSVYRFANLTNYSVVRSDSLNGKGQPHNSLTIALPKQQRLLAHAIVPAPLTPTAGCIPRHMGR